MRRDPDARKSARSNWKPSSYTMPNVALDASGQDRDHARREAAPLGRFGKRHHHQSAVLGHLVEVREHLDLIVVGAEDVRLHRIVVLGGSEAAIGVGGLVARG